MSVKIIVGDHKMPEGFKRLSAFRKDVFRLRSIIEVKGWFVDCDDLKINAKDIKWIIENAQMNVVLLVRNREKLKRLPKSISVMEHNKWGESVDIFECLNTVFKSKDRQSVLKYLLDKKPPPLLLFNWMASNIDKIRNENLLMYLDEKILHKKSPEWFYEFLAFGVRPIPARGFIRYQYRIGKGLKCLQRNLDPRHLMRSGVIRTSLRKYD